MARLTKSKLTGTDLSKLINQKNPELREILRGARQLFDKEVTGRREEFHVFKEGTGSFVRRGQLS